MAGRLRLLLSILGTKMANTYVIQRTRVVRIHEWLRVGADTSADALYCVEKGEYERDDWDEIDEVPVGEESEGAVIVDVEEIKDDY
jgi:hypothetical protein